MRQGSNRRAPPKLVVLRLALTATALLLSNATMADDIGSLADLRWKHRVLLGSTPTPEPVLALLAAEEAELQGRDLIYFMISDSMRFTSATGQQSDSFWEEVARHVSDGGYALIGRDGGVKARYPTLDLDVVFALIDTMPMRREEMRAQEAQ